MIYQRCTVCAGYREDVSADVRRPPGFVCVCGLKTKPSSTKEILGYRVKYGAYTSRHLLTRDAAVFQCAFAQAAYGPGRVRIVRVVRKVKGL